MGKSMPKKKGGNLSRKELRKASKEKDRLKRQEHHAKIHQKKVTSPGSLMKAATMIKAKPQTEKSKSMPKETTDSSKISDAPLKTSKLAYKDPLIEKEDAEIARLEKLMGLNKGKSKKSISSKLNREFELFEGIGGGFGDFLSKLDMLSESIEKEDAEEEEGTSKKTNSKKRKMIFADGSDDEDEQMPEEFSGKGHIIDDDEQERSDIDEEMDEDDLYYDSEEEGDEEEGSDEYETMSEEGSEAPDLVSDPDEQQDDDDDDEEEEDEEGQGDSDDSEDGDEDSKEGEEEEEGRDSDEDEEEGDSDEDENQKQQQLQSSTSLFTYRPAKGEDIYGRSTETGGGDAGGDGPKKYIPPAKRKEMLSKIDEQSDAVRMVRKQLNSLMNKLSDQSKDAIVRSIHQVFSSNSVSVCSLVLKDCIMAACANPTQLMSSLIPIYAATVAALHFSVGADVGAFIIESLSVSLHQAIAASTSAAAPSGSLVSNKLPNNALLLLVYLYNLRVVHHTLIVDIMNELAGVTEANISTSNTSSSSSGNDSASRKEPFMELRVELIECLINHCGTSIRADDPASLKTVINTLSKIMKSLNESSSDGSTAENSRMRFMFEALTDLKNNKSRRIQTDNAEVVKGLRKWLGTIKNSLASSRAGGADLCLRVTLRDLLDAEKRGRWWRAGASWTGKDKTEGGSGDDVSAQSRKAAAAAPVVNEEEAKLLKLAAKMRMNTATRRSIFVVLMSSRDVTDAFERLQRLELKGKQDREIVRVITECCGQEKTYNPFYFELAKVLCLQNRQYKTTFQFAFWDFFKQFDAASSSENEEQALSSRRVVNFARLLAQLICSFQLPLTTIKTIEMSNLNPKMILFISTFFLALFKENISDEDFQNVVDRVATTKDFALVRDNILFFLRRYLEKIPSGLDPAESKKIQRRKKTTIKTMEAMTVLDVSKGMMDPEDLD